MHRADLASGGRAARGGMGRSPDAGPFARVETGGVRKPDVTELLRLGRDREAAELAGGTMDVLQQLDDLAPVLGGVMGGIDPSQLDNPTPCAEFTVRGVLEHMVGGATMFAAGFTGTEPVEPDLADPLGAIGPTLGRLIEAMHSPGALDRTIQAPFGAVPGTTFARFVVLDGLVHGWDVATATGQPYEPSDALVAEVSSFAEEALPPLRDGTTFADAVEPPAGATPIERLAALTGRVV
jgi:uncharacterized protein (TIGR03086 family)